MLFTQKRIFSITSFTIAIILISQIAFAAPVVVNKNPVEPGITPDSWMYFVDVAIDNLNLALTSNPTDKAKKGLEIARERLAEVKEMADNKDIESAQKAQKEHDDILDVVKTSINEIENTNSTQEFEDETEIENELEEHKAEIKEVRDGLKIKIKVKGDIIPEQQALIGSILASLDGKASEVGIEINSKKGKTKIKIEQETEDDDKLKENQQDDIKDNETEDIEDSEIENDDFEDNETESNKTEDLE